MVSFIPRINAFGFVWSIDVLSADIYDNPFTALTKIEQIN